MIPLVIFDRSIGGSAAAWVNRFIGADCKVPSSDVLGEYHPVDNWEMPPVYPSQAEGREVYLIAPFGVDRHVWVQQMQKLSGSGWSAAWAKNMGRLGLEDWERVSTSHGRNAPPPPHLLRYAADDALDLPHSAEIRAVMAEAVAQRSVLGAHPVPIVDAFDRIYAGLEALFGREPHSFEHTIIQYGRQLLEPGKAA